MNGSTTAVASPAVHDAADRLLSQRGHSFHWARSLLSARHAERATRLYGFCRRVDDLADEASDAASARAALGVIRLALQGGACHDAETGDMLQLMRDCQIDAGVPLELMRGVESDLADVRMRDMDELLHYCYQVAGTVGLMMTAVLDVRAPEALPHAIDLGIAMQLTNICRDVRDDALLARRYLPASLVGDIEPAALVDPTHRVRAIATEAMRFLLETADHRYASAERGLHHLPAGARTGILVAARCYHGIGTVLRERKLDCWSSRARVSSAGKAVITLRALAARVGAQPAGSAPMPVAAVRAKAPGHNRAANTRETGLVDRS